MFIFSDQSCVGFKVHNVAKTVINTTVFEVTFHAWHTGIGRGWPLSGREEAALVAQLPSPASTRLVTRGDVTTLMLTCREGATVSYVEKFLPGANLKTIAAAHVLMSKRLKKALIAWNTIQNDPHPATIAAHIDDMATVLPVPAARIASALSPTATHSLNATLSSINLRVNMATKDAVLIEEKLFNPTNSPSAMLTYSAQLFCPHGDSAWSNPYFVPVRVGQLNPWRVASLLGEAVERAV